MGNIPTKLGFSSFRGIVSTPAATALPDHHLLLVLLHQPLNLSLLFPCPARIPHVTASETVLTSAHATPPVSETVNDFARLTGHSLHSLAEQTRLITKKSDIFVQFYLQTFPLPILCSRHIKLFSICRFENTLCLFMASWYFI